MNRVVKVQGIECPMIREGDNIVDIVVDSILEETSIVFDDWESETLYTSGYDINDKDIIGITESVIARAAGQYVTVDDIVKDVCSKFQCHPLNICLVNPIYSRNRFSLILKGIARAADKISIILPKKDEVGNPSGKNRFTGVDITKYYTNICKEEDCICEFLYNDSIIPDNVICCQLRDYKKSVDNYKFRLSYEGTQYGKVFSLADICSDKSPDWGLLGTNKATEEKLKLFPSIAECQRVCESVKAKIKEKTGKDVIVCVYGDGCFKDPVGGIWEFADPTTMPYYTDKEIIEGTPNEIKLKSLIDSTDAATFIKLNDDEIKKIIEENHNPNMQENVSSMGTTPRVYRDSLASLMDLISGSGDRGTPVVLVQNYF